jgi:hypothetical protein
MTSRPTEGMPEHEITIRALQICLKQVCDDYRDLRIAFYSHPGKLSNGMCPALHKAYMILEESLEEWPRQRLTRAS